MPPIFLKNVEVFTMILSGSYTKKELYVIG